MADEPTTQTESDAAATDSGAVVALEPPTAVGVVEPADADDLVPLDDARRAEVEAEATVFVEAVLAADPRGPEFAERLHAVTGFGNDAMAASAEVSNRMLDRPRRAARANGFGDSESTVRDQLHELRVTVERLDPSGAGPKGVRGLLTRLPFGNRLDGYFDRYRSAQGELNDVLEALRRGRDELDLDNETIESEKVRLWDAMQDLEGYVELGKQVDAALESKLAEIDATDPDRAQRLRNDVLLPVRQKVQDLLTQLAVSAQGYLALNLIQHNNRQLMVGVDRASTTTVSALRTAVMVSEALATQRLVLDQVDALRSTTSSLIEGTARQLREQSGRVAEQSMRPTVDLDSLRSAFTDIYATIDEVDAYRAQALDAMAATVTELEAEMGRARVELQRVQQADGDPTSTAGQLQGSGQLRLPSRSR